MRAPRFVLSLLAVLGAARGGEEIFDRVEDALTFSAKDAPIRARVSGLFDLETYRVQLPAPGVISTIDGRVSLQRLNVFLDAQFGTGVYVFAQARADRGFDPSEDRGQVRLDEWAVRITPGPQARFNFQVGKFATVVGSWAGRHASWANPFITAPLPYEHLTGVWDTEAVRNSNVLLQWSHLRPGLPANVTAIEKRLRLPIIWGPSYVTGAAVSGSWRRFIYAAEVKFGSLSSRPEAWQHPREQWEHPTVSARVAYRPNQMWNVGISASQGTYLRESATGSIPRGFGRGDYEQRVLAHDLSFAWHHLQIWGEVFAARFEIPNVGNADTAAYYVEAKYKVTPQLFAALRWNQQLFARIPDRLGRVHWGDDVWRVDFAPGYRFTPHTQVKLQYSLQNAEAVAHRYTRTIAAQFAARF